MDATTLPRVDAGAAFVVLLPSPVMRLVGSVGELAPGLMLSLAGGDREGRGERPGSRKRAGCSFGSHY